MQVDERRRLMIIKLELLTYSEEVLVVIRALSAQIVDFIPASVFLLEEYLHILHVIAIDAFRANRWESHSDNFISDVRQVEIEAVFLVPNLLQGDQPLGEVPSLVRFQIFALNLLFHLPNCGRGA